MPLERCTETTCFGCGACAAACPKDAIAMTPGEGGFPYPRVDAAQCVRCGLCDRVCPIGATEPLLRAPRQAFAAWARDAGARAASTSGGAFTACAKATLAAGGAVCGAELRLAERRVRHAVIAEPADLPRIRKTKYVQSETVPALREAMRLLGAGRTVLFAGTPCQVAGWRRLTARFGERALACDLVCGGMPSPALFARYLAEEERRAGAPLADYDFRDKRDGWDLPCVRLTFANGSETRRPLRLDAFYATFAAKLSCRLSCATCPFARRERVGDLTFADCWHVARFRADYDDGRGTSLVLANSEAGERLLGDATGLWRGPYDVAHAIASNEPLRKPLGASPGRADFLSAALADGASPRRLTWRTLGVRWLVRAWLTRKAKRAIRFLRRGHA